MDQIWGSLDDPEILGEKPMTDLWDWHIYLHLVDVYGKCK